MNFTGYFLLGSKFGGLMRKPSTLSPCAPVNQNGSRGGMEISPSRRLLRSATTPGETSLILPVLEWLASILDISFSTALISTPRIRFGNLIDISVRRRV